jgi:hypothetical protein
MNTKNLIADLIARGVQFHVDGDKLRFRPLDRLTSNDVVHLRQHKAGILEVLRLKGREARLIDPDRDYAGADCASASRPHQDKDQSPAGASSPTVTHREYSQSGSLLQTCDRCGSTEYRDVPIHGGRSTRRDCASCSRFLGWPKWYDAPASNR